ncbi:hypothetical protein ABT224_37620 [Streptomyces sp. NPDC001584]|uniref:hypothetical protein n=1 Tax=Streptomyces sp. NPDC001584 TaxID=3154521 RepID=UPI003324994C
MPNAKGKPCVIATGGGPCHRHEGQHQASVEAAMKLVSLYEPAGADPLFAVEQPAVEEDRSSPGATPAGEPGATPLSPAFVARTLNLG